MYVHLLYIYYFYAIHSFKKRLHKQRMNLHSRNNKALIRQNFITSLRAIRNSATNRRLVHSKSARTSRRKEKKYHEKRPFERGDKRRMGCKVNEKLDLMPREKEREPVCDGRGRLCERVQNREGREKERARSRKNVPYSPRNSSPFKSSERSLAYFI